MNERSFAAYSGSRSGPRMTTASTTRIRNSQPLMSSTSLPRGSGGRSVGRRLEDHLDSPLARPATHRQLDGLAHRLGADRHDELVRVGDDPAVELHDDVAGLEAGAVGRTTLGDGVAAVLRAVGDPDAGTVVGGVEDDPDHRVGGLAGGDELLGGLARLVARDREADADTARLAVVERVGARDPGDRGVDHADE